MSSFEAGVRVQVTDPRFPVIREVFAAAIISETLVFSDRLDPGA